MHNVCTYSYVHKPAQQHNRPYNLPHVARHNRVNALTELWRLSKPFYRARGPENAYRLRIIEHYRARLLHALDILELCVAYCIVCHSKVYLG